MAFSFLCILYISYICLNLTRGFLIPQRRNHISDQKADLGISDAMDAAYWKDVRGPKAKDYGNEDRGTTAERDKKWFLVPYRAYVNVKHGKHIY